tara:strand:+ start:97 stop:1449 length:1353 start_codon:yes stop_codon:yes gene_type:complete
MEDAAASLGGQDEARQGLASEEADFRWALLVGILAVAATIAIGDQLESRHIHRIPEAAVGVIAGVACAALAKLTHNDEMLRDDTFSAEFFMVWLLPPIIFAAGFNLNIPAFVASIVPTILLAFVGTVVSSAAVGGLVFSAGQLGVCYPLSRLASFFFGAVVSATDPVSVLAVFKAIGVREDIFAIVFGESVLNDAVAIVLARTVLTFNHPAAKEGGAAAGLALLVFVAIFLGSTLIGGVAGAASALLFKALRLSERPGTEVVEASLSFALPWAAFYASEALGLSGIVAILFCGVVMATYVRPNLRRAALVGAQGWGSGLSSGLRVPNPPPSPSPSSSPSLPALPPSCSRVAASTRSPRSRRRSSSFTSGWHFSPSPSSPTTPSGSSPSSPSSPASWVVSTSSHCCGLPRGCSAAAERKRAFSPRRHRSASVPSTPCASGSQGCAAAWPLR